MIYLKTPEQLELMRNAATLVSRTLGEIAKWALPGVTTRKIDTVAREFIRDNGGIPACLGYGGFPGTVCCEVNETVVHGFPRSMNSAKATSSVPTQWWSSTVSAAICATPSLSVR